MTPDIVFGYPDFRPPDMYRNVGFEVLTAMTMNSTVFWVVTPCSSYRASNSSSIKLSLSVMIRNQDCYKKILCDGAPEAVRYKTCDFNCNSQSGITVSVSL
jgi:hypothetical protein